jgi:hypothetical protein
MFKAGIIAFAIGAAAAGTTVWLKTELHDKAHLKGLPVQEVRDPF